MLPPSHNPPHNLQTPDTCATHHELTRAPADFFFGESDISTKVHVSLYWPSVIRAAQPRHIPISLELPHFLRPTRVDISPHFRRAQSRRPLTAATSPNTAFPLSRAAHYLLPTTHHQCWEQKSIAGVPTVVPARGAPLVSRPRGSPMDCSAAFSSPAAEQNAAKRYTAGGGEYNTGIMNEVVLRLVFCRLNWDPHVLSVAARVSRRIGAVAKRVLWREACISRAPRMVRALTSCSPTGPSRVCGGWLALGKLLFYCCGGEASNLFPLPRRLPGHFVGVSRFSKTSGRCFLARRLWGDLLYISDPCEHALEGAPGGEDLGAYRGVFGGFVRSKTRAILIGRQVELDLRVRCPYCRARVWSMTAARLVPRSASRRLGAHCGRLEYFVCVNGHLHGNCWLSHLSSSDDDGDGGGGDDEDER